MKFEYQAIDENGGIVRGIIAAKTAQKVLQILLHKQLHPIDIRHLTDTTVEISRLNQLKEKLKGKKKVEPKQVMPEPVEELKPDKPKFDWTYLIFLVIMAGLLVLAVLG